MPSIQEVGETRLVGAFSTGLAMMGIALGLTGCSDSGLVEDKGPTALPPTPKPQETKKPSYCDQFPDAVVLPVDDPFDTLYGLSVQAMGGSIAGVQICGHAVIVHEETGSMFEFTGDQIVNPNENIPPSDLNTTRVNIGDTVCVGASRQAVIKACCSENR